MSKSIWSFQFHTKNLSYGAGTAVLDGDQLVGGDASFYHVGKLSFENDAVTGSVCVNKHGSGPSFFGAIQSYTLSLTGHRKEDQMTLSGYMVENPLLKVTMELKKILDLE